MADGTHQRGQCLLQTWGRHEVACLHAYRAWTPGIGKRVRPDDQLVGKDEKVPAALLRSTPSCMNSRTSFHSEERVLTVILLAPSQAQMIDRTTGFPHMALNRIPTTDRTDDMISLALGYARNQLTLCKLAMDGH